MKLTILMYHKIDELIPGIRFPGNYVTPRQFEQQLDALLEWGYRTISLDEWIDHRDGRRRSLPAKPLVLTFDDGYTCFDRNAWPAMRARGLHGTVYLVAGEIGGWNSWDRGERREPLLDAARIHALQQEGVEFGSHGVTHPPLAKVDAPRAFDELARSRRMLADVLNRDVTTFAYPFSNQSAAVRALARQAGYRSAVRGKGRMNRRSTDPFGLRRIKVDHTTTIRQLERTLFVERYLRL
ncbi:MAG TPA: polysaccharide deacetylase family protein [Gemmatimonadaceae bacterium]|jgi:peptidoglycan/xylan/chitin deacetylase (PgdA/CDA1 family)|nr:polysaccharide deacetylase family protein [Gemmatimonadaceae bacterium]